MKKWKKFTAMLFAMIMFLSMSTTTLAYTIQLKNDSNSPTTGHTYNVYQIFTGDLATDKITLSNVKYGKNYGTEGAAVPSEVLDQIKPETVVAFAKELLNNDNNNDITGDPFGILNTENNWKIEDVPAGYYLIQDKGVPADGDSYSAYIIQVVDNVSMAPKSKIITSDKVITSDDYNDNYKPADADTEIDDSVTDDGKYSNGGIGTRVDYKLTVNVPENAANYNYYYCVLNDTLSEGLTFDETSVVVKVGDTTKTLNTDYKLYVGDAADGKTFQIAMLDAKSLKGKTITATYSATINENAKIGVEGNPNKFDVTYSNNPNYSYVDDKDGKPNEDEPVGVTPEQETRTYVTGIKLLKTDEDGNVLTGAEFTITGDSVKYVLVSEEKFTEDVNGTYWKLTNKTYTTTEPTKETAEKYESTEIKYIRTIEYTIKDNSEANKEIKAFVDSEKGIVYFKGLGEGVYTIIETVTPDGYNTIDPITVTIDWTAPAAQSADKNCTWTATAKTGEDENSKKLILNDEGVFELTIVNEKGVELPETGGIGTTLFYIIGGVLVVAAMVLLITKKKMSAEK